MSRWRSKIVGLLLLAATAGVVMVQAVFADARHSPVAERTRSGEP